LKLNFTGSIIVLRQHVLLGT